MTSATQRTNRIRGRVRDYILYVLITVAFAGMVFMIQGRWGHEALIRWGGLAGFTAVLFGYFVGDSRQHLRQHQFWVLTAILLVLHLTAFVILLSHVEEWKLMWFTGMVIEYPVFMYFRSRLPYPS
jgi:hypothetical protein